MNNHTEKLNFGQRIALELLWGFCLFFSWLPYWFKYYVVEEVIYFLLRYVLRYRRRVICENLRNSFPEKSEAERRRIMGGAYLNLAEMFVNTLNLAGSSNELCRACAMVPDWEETEREVAGRDWIAMSGHVGCWEYCSFLGLYDYEHLLFGVYHPLKNRVMEALYHRLRRRDNMIAVPMKEVVRCYMRHKADPQAGHISLGLLADQNPPRRPDSHWFDFLNQKTIFFDGGEKLARRFHMPVYFTHIRQVKRGYYEMQFIRIYDGDEPVADNVITERYVRLLEEMIREEPALWLWSHRRWKHKPAPGEATD